MLSSCSSNDDNSNSEEDLIIGTWHGVSSILDGNNLGVPSNSIVKFTSNNRTEFIYEVPEYNGGEYTIEIEKGSWSKNNNTLTITWDESDVGLEIYVLTITELSSNSLTWKTTLAGEGELIETFKK